MKQYTVLVTAIGGDLGKAVCKALRYSPYNIKIIGTDCKDYIPYPLFCDSFSIIPKADTSKYIDSISTLILNNSVDLVYICSEQELLYISDHSKDINADIFRRMVILPKHVIDICRDKYKTIKMLENNKLPYPHSVLYNHSKPIHDLLKGFNYPFVVKKTCDCGSKHLHIIDSPEGFESLKGLDSTFMIQEYIPGIEYTNAVYKDAFTGEIYVITLERTMKNGMSNQAKVVFDKDIEKLCKTVAAKLNIVGSVNIQLRKQENLDPIIFEINPRYSSTSFMRARFGFNDVIFAFENMVLGKAISSPKIVSGEAYRYITEYYKFY